MSTRLRKIYAFLLLFTAVCCLSHSSQAQATQELFGKNRVQYKKFDWKAISTTNFEIYFYQDGNDAAYQAARYAESDFDRIADLLGYTPYAKTKIFIYNSFSDLQQSNVGVSNEDALFSGQTSFVKSRVEVPFSGNQVDFKKDLSRGIAQVFISEMMFGGSLKDMVQSSVLLSLPDWYMAGAAAYVAEGWSLDMDDYVRDAILNKNIRKPAILSGASATLVGQSIWNYIAERYGKGNISNILNLTRIIRNEETSISSTLGIPYSRFTREWKDYYANNANRVVGSYQEATPNFKSRKRNRRGYLYNKVRLSPDGKYVAYSENYKGIYSVVVSTTDKKSRQTVLKGGYKVLSQRVDRQIPLIAWQNNTSLAIIDVEKGKNRLSVYEVGKRRKRKVRRFLTGYNQISDFDISKDGTMMVLSADKDGQSDIFLAGLNRVSSKQVTHDLYDDLFPHFVGESNSSFVFSSNRQSDSLSKGKEDYRSIEDNFDIYLYEDDHLKRLTNSVSNANRPIATDARTVYYLNDEKGIRNLYKYTLDNAEVTQVTSFRQNIREYDLNVATNQIAYYTIADSREYVGWQNQFDFTKKVNPVFSKRNESLEGRIIQAGPVGVKPDSGAAASSVEVTGKKTGNLEPGEIDTDNYQFDTDVVKQDNSQPAKTTNTTGTNAPLLISKAPKKDNVTIRGPFPYQRRFSTNNVMSTLLINPLTGWGLHYDVTMNDMLEDHILKVGGLINIDLRSNNFFGEYRYLKNRIDYGLRIDRKSIFISNESAQKYRFNKVTLSAAYPFSVSSRISVSPFYIITRAINIGDQIAIAMPDAKTNYGGVRLEYVFDNTLVNGMNMIEGTRIKIKYENYLGIRANKESFNNLSIDLRNYQKIHRDLIFATRLSYGQFGGNAPKKYLLGGMDNWLFNAAEVQGAGNPLARDSRDWYFLEFATNMRGFKYNKYFGEKYVLFNAELRMPIIKYFYRGPITSNFFRNLQFVAFSDVGTAWTGNGPFSRQNSLNTVVEGTEGNPFRATVTNFKNPFLSSYGAGVRTFLLGYYAKFDVAWGVEDYVVQTPMYYLTLGYDF